ncbi:MAG: hypothetical protein ACOYXT_07025 [Bacteroidota bacterium]
MKNEQRIVELLAEMLHKFDILNGEVKGLKDEMKGVNKRLDKVEKHIVKLNMISAENSRALMKLADHGSRNTRLEKAVYK